MSLTARLAMRDPPAVGTKVALTVQLPAGSNEPPQLLLWVKSELFVPVMLTPLRFKEAFPVFTSTTAAVLLVVPTVCGAKFFRLGYAVRKGPFTPVPFNETARGLIRVLSVKLMEPA